ncbi:effector-associated domain EAD1-containing protein [Pseudarthrobacter sp. BIM B-2242]|uniref:effector-associated domain EAD1-containing protein n=1 Tax=Pseudarthrobacter sp. BIM B-2242 TaxID=2772401 RepID=UPI00168B6347|nr:effector-associated domain EAD1-containing protein [Pseudarthrobacter sp. BIM B-2242]QOD05017.1 hypothetical protein IDT60_08410 [Pseudarthrobacter sp. BIM B-2242]
MSELENAEVLLAEAQRRSLLGRSALAEQLALLGTFSPDRLSTALAADDEGEGDPRSVLELLSRRLPSGELMLEDLPRINALTRMLSRGGHPELARVRRTISNVSDSPLQRMLDAFVLGGGPELEERDEDELIASLDVWGWATEAVARAHLVGLSPVTPGKDAIESRLALLNVTRAVRRLAAGGCLGREVQLGRLHGYLRRHSGPHDLRAEPAMVVYGIGGVGKSTLVARFVLDLYDERFDPATGVFAYLDLDRPTLADCDPEVLLTDITEQVAAQLTGHRRQFARNAEVKRRLQRGAGLEASDSAGSYRQQASQLVADLRLFAGGAIAVVLDTYEQLERNHPEQRGPVYELFGLLAADLPGFRLVVSGRSPATAFLDPARPDRVMRVPALEEPAALALLRHFVHKESERARRPAVEVGDELGREIVDLIGGIPLTLRLAARVLVQEGPEVLTDLRSRSRALDHLREEFVRGFLYQRILDHITAHHPPVTTPDLRRLARVSIVLRRITVELVECVLVPSLAPAPAGTATELFEELAGEVAFVELDGGVLRLREELRVPALVALRLADPGLVRHVHEQAAEFYRGRPGEEDKLEFAYHRLALGTPPDEFDEATLRRLAPATDDLPPSSAATLRDAVKNPARLVTARMLEEWENSIFPVVDAALREGRVAEARRLLSERPDRSPGTELYRLESRLAQAEHDLPAATDAAARDLKAAEAAADPTRFAAAALRLANLNELSGLGSAADEVLRAADDAKTLAGWVLLRLELLLNRMNLRERTRLENEEDRWLLEMQARSLMQRASARELAGNSALVRLLAAALGAEEPDRLREALRLIGLGHEEDPARVALLIESLADWDSSLDPPGKLASASNLRLEGGDPGSVRRAWSALSGLGTDATHVLDRVWEQIRPSVVVRERLREIYLWWAVGKPMAAVEASSGAPGSPAFSHSAGGGGAPPVHLRTDDPIDWSRPEVLQLEELILTAYPTSTDLLSLASRAGLDQTLISWASSGRRITREVLGVASRAHQLGDIVEAMLTDPEAVSVHWAVRQLMGEEWLSEHHPDA